MSKKGEILSRKLVRIKKKVFWRIHLKSDLQSAKSDSQCQKHLANHFSKMIHNYPNSDSHLAMRIRLFPALLTYIYTYMYIYCISLLIRSIIKNSTLLSIYSIIIIINGFSVSMKAHFSVFLFHFWWIFSSIFWNITIYRIKTVYFKSNIDLIELNW